MEMKLSLSIWIRVFAFGCFALLSAAQSFKGFDFFYFVQQWPGSYCAAPKGCCQKGKPASDFIIHGLWPNYKDGSYPSNCDPDQQFNPSQISEIKSRMQIDWPSIACPSSDGRDLNFWGQEWNKHGTCCASLFNQHDYFAAALNLKKKVNLLKALTTAGIKPDGGAYDLESIKKAIKDGIGYEAYVECIDDTSGYSNLYQIYVCVDTDGSTLIECPVLPRGKTCDSRPLRIEFPTFF